MVNNLTVTDINIFPVKTPQPESKLLAYAKVVINDALVISGIRVVNGKDKNGKSKVFLGFPNNYNKDTQESYDIVFPITAEMREYLTIEVLKEFQKKLETAKAYSNEQ